MINSKLALRAEAMQCPHNSSRLFVVFAGEVMRFGLSRGAAPMSKWGKP